MRKMYGASPLLCRRLLSSVNTENNNKSVQRVLDYGATVGATYSATVQSHVSEERVVRSKMSRSDK